MKKSSLVSIGLRAKTGRAIAVVLGGTTESPIVLRKFEMKLTDPKIRTTAQPYHEVMELPWEESQIAVKKSARAIETVARKALALLVKELNTDGLSVKGVGIVGARDRDLARIGNYHIRAHAAEGILFRRVLDLAAGANGIKRTTFPDREFESVAARELGPENAKVKKKLHDLRRVVSPPWRTDEKQAAIAAWLVLHGSRK